MTEQTKVRISALVDDELSHTEISQEINKLLVDPADQSTWSRYHLIGDAMRRETGPVIDVQLAQAIHKRIEQEPVVFAPGALKSTSPKWLKPAAGFAIAASVAALAFTIGPQFINPQPSGGVTPSIAAQAPNDENIYLAEDGTRWEMLGKPKVESRLNSYLVNHQEYAPASNMKGIMPYATFVSYDGGR
jgi:sigma-E factor negative regulatory protein RseA